MIYNRVEFFQTKGRPVSFDRAWFQNRLKAVEVSQRQLAKHLGIDPASVTQTFKGERELKIEEAKKIAEVLKVGMNEVLRRAGIDVKDDIHMTPVVGYMDGRGEVTFVAHGSEDRVVGPADLPADAIAIQARTAMSKMASLDRWILFLSMAKEQPDALAGRLCLAGCRDGSMIVAHIQRGYKSGLFNLHIGVGTEMRENVDLLWASPVLWLKPA
jgi:transcriptional regulator with XRE-family HTH domain